MIILEDYILYILCRRVSLITKDPFTEDANWHVNKHALTMCSVLSFPTIFKDTCPIEVSLSLKSLIKKGLIKEYDVNGFPSFIPTSKIKIQTP